ncbi:hypothetical protein [Micromonospora sp. NPDC049679]|uniref:hypothetical protein n=1 Tax=Micromonospora sp. NPDC049679 TaxID=3155920 RepID=UPI0033FC242C
MSTWQGVRRELAGAWRSLRYDLARRPTATRHPYGSADWAEGRKPRRLLAMSGIGMLAVVGAIGTYFGVVIGLGALISDEGAPAEQAPVLVRPDRPVTQDVVLTPDPTLHPAVNDSPAPPRRATPSRSPSPRRSGEPNPSRSSPPLRQSPSPSRSSVSPSASVTPSPSPSSPGTPTVEPSLPPPTGG